MNKTKATDILGLTNAVNKKKSVKKQEVIPQSGLLPYSPELVQGYEPEFIDGYKLRNGSFTITVDEVEKAVKRNENVLLIGHTGTGKSVLASHVIDEMNKEILLENRNIHGRNLPLISAGVPANKLEMYHDLNIKRILYNGHVGTRTEHMVGTIDVQYDENGNRHVVRVPGFLTYPYITPKCKLIWDEMDFTLPEVLGESHVYLDGRTNQVDVFLNGRWSLNRQKDFSVIATANTTGNGENQSEYAGTNCLSKAFLNRFNFVVHLDYLPHDDEVRLLRKKNNFRKDIADAMVKAANNMREAKANGAVDYALSTRDLLAWVRACKDDDQHEKTSSKNDYWNNIARKYIYTSFLNRIDDEAIREAYDIYLSL
jgi:MoxR-like ATPase